MWRFKIGDVVKTNYHGPKHASGWPNGKVFILREQFGVTWDGKRAWWDPDRRFYWEEAWLEPAEKPKKGFGRWFHEVQNR